ncbi:beta-1,6-N-acetylglucosaminyltransferase [Methylorubrum aminovorans]
MTAYFITCHQSPAFVRDQFRFLYHRDHVYLYHVDAKAPEALHDTVRRLAEAFPNVEVLPTRHYAWASYSQVATTLDAIAWALKSAPAWSHFVALSEQHCPLHDPNTLAAALQPGVSYVGMTPFSAMDAGGQVDIAHRFSMDYRELPGVGSFGIAALARDPDFLSRLHHGSNWYVLSRVACAYLRDTVPSLSDMARFRRCVHADEDMLQTLLAHTDGRAGTIACRETTFVAWPHVIGNDSMIFRERDFFAAREDGWLFIRKRPALLPERVAVALEASAAMTETDLTGAVGACPEAVPTTPDTDGIAFARRIARAVVRRGRGVRADLLNLRYGRHDPLVSLTFQTDRVPDDVEIRVVSQNLSDFRVLLLSMAPPAIDFSTRHVHGRLAPLLRVRSDDFLCRREILVQEDPTHGFWTLPSDGSISGLVRRIERYIGVAETFGGPSEPLAASGAFSMALRETKARWRSAHWMLRRLLRRTTA